MPPADNKPEQIDLSAMDIGQLKIHAYDLIALKERAERELQIVNNAIAAKSNEEPAPVPPPPPAEVETEAKSK